MHGILDSWVYIATHIGTIFSVVSEYIVRLGSSVTNSHFAKVRIYVTAWLAQSVEHGTLNPRVVGSSPTSGAFFVLFFIQHFTIVHRLYS